MLRWGRVVRRPRLEESPRAAVHGRWRALRGPAREVPPAPVGSAMHGVVLLRFKGGDLLLHGELQAELMDLPA
eukprot:scaffold676107_cov38-Prasinocladus_malaysianus.AAC.2